MAVILQMTYMKKLGLPNFSSHSCAVSLTVEIADASVAAQALHSFKTLGNDPRVALIAFLAHGIAPADAIPGVSRPLDFCFVHVG